MITFDELTKKLSDEKLKTAYEDILEWRKTGILQKESILRIIWEKFNKENQVDYPLHGIEGVILSEIAKRYYGF